MKDIWYSFKVCKGTNVLVSGPDVKGVESVYLYTKQIVIFYLYEI